MAVFSALVVVPLLATILLSLEAVSTLQAATRLKQNSAVLGVLGAKYGDRGTVNWGRPGLQNVFALNMQGTGLEAAPLQDVALVRDGKVFDWSVRQRARPFYTQLFGNSLTDAVKDTERLVNVQAHWRARKTEYALVVDESFSFSDGGLEEEVSEALKAFTGAVFAGKAERDDTWISIVGFANKVNIGRVYADRLVTPKSRKVPREFRIHGYSDYLSPGGPEGDPERNGACVKRKPLKMGEGDKRLYIAAIGHPPPSPDKGFDLHVLTADEASTLDMDIRDDPGNPIFRGFRVDVGFRDDKATGQKIDLSIGTSTHCGLPMLVLSNERKAVLERITKAYTPLFGNTGGDEGFAWAYRTLAPEWREVWNDGGRLAISGNAPAAWDDTDVDKKLVYISDGGANEGYSDPTGTRCSTPLSGIRCKTGWEDAPYITPDLCEYIKDRGIELIVIIYGDALRMARLGRKDRILRRNFEKCASPDQYYETDEKRSVTDILLSLARQSYRVRVSAR